MSPKAISATDLAEAITRVAAGEVVLSPRLAGFVLDAFAGEPPKPSDPELDQLTAREQEGARTHRARLPLQGGCQHAWCLDTDGGDSRVGRPSQAPPLQPSSTRTLGGAPEPRRLSPNYFFLDAFLVAYSEQCLSAEGEDQLMREQHPDRAPQAQHESNQREDRPYIQRAMAHLCPEERP